VDIRVGHVVDRTDIALKDGWHGARSWRVRCRRTRFAFRWITGCALSG